MGPYRTYTLIYMNVHKHTAGLYYWTRRTMQWGRNAVPLVALTKPQCATHSNCVRPCPYIYVIGRQTPFEHQATPFTQHNKFCTCTP